MPVFEEFEKIIKVVFKDKDLLRESLTHRSYLNENSDWKYPHNERLEFLGDAVLELIVSEELFRKYPRYPEGKLTLLRAALVNYQILARIATAIGLNDFILMSKGESRDIGKAREVILANAIEAVIGAMYLDRGFDTVKAFAERFILSHLDEVVKTGSYKDSKSELQEIIQERYKVTPTYKVLNEEGPAHQRIFTVGVYFGQKLIDEGKGASKQEGETEAAKNALKRYK